MKYAYLVEQDNSQAAAFALTDLRPQFLEQSLDVSSLDIRAGWMREDCFERALVLALHRHMVPPFGTIVQAAEAIYRWLFEKRSPLSVFPFHTT